MTSNQIAYWELQERKRANQAQEAETNRANVSRELENYRSNTTKERETQRSNLMQELLSRDKLKIDSRRADIESRKVTGQNVTNSIKAATDLSTAFTRVAPWLVSMFI